MKLKEWHRVNFEQRDDGIYYCDGNHEKNEDCTSHEVKLTIDDIKDIIKQGQAFDLGAVSLDEQRDATVCEHKWLYRRKRHDGRQKCVTCNELI